MELWAAVFDPRDNMIWSLAFALLSALIWFAAALVQVPKTAWLVPGVGGGRPSPELDTVLRQLRRQSWLNCAAAVSMTASVALQVLHL
jgi:hypothetical protein